MSCEHIPIARLTLKSTVQWRISLMPKKCLFANAWNEVNRGSVARKTAWP